MTLSNDSIRLALSQHEIGGGVGHTPDVSLSDATTTVRSPQAFVDAVDSGAAVIGIPGDAQIDLSGRDITLSGQTVVSDRGQDGSPGALLYTTDHGESSPAWDGGSNGRGLITMRGGSRLSGVRLRGPYHDYNDNPAYPGYIPLDEGNASERRRKREQRYARGIRILSSDVEVDNCELYGWPNQAINIGTSGSAYSPHIHHIYGHDCMMEGFGYVVDVIRGHPTIEKSYFNATRHSIDGFGYPDGGYTLEDCVFGPITRLHLVDMHSLSENGHEGDLTAGGRMEIRRNTFVPTHGITGNGTQAIAIRGYPDDAVVVENNHFAHEIDGDEPPANVGNASGAAPYRQVNVGSGWHSFEVRDNYYGDIETHQADYGAPVDITTVPDLDDNTTKLTPTLYRALLRLEPRLVRLRDALD